jgi:hypothetical protein
MQLANSPLTSHSEMEAATPAPTATKPDRATTLIAILADSLNLAIGFRPFS